MDSLAPRVKLSDWLQTVAYDSIYDSAERKADFQAATGFTPPAWHEEPLAKMYESSQSVFTDPKTPRDRIITTGIDIAQAIEREFVPHYRPESEYYIGRGRTFDAIVATLRKAGL
jgi:hypothetical protein